MRILEMLKKELVGKKLISSSNIELNDAGDIDVDFYNEEGLDHPVLGEVITDVEEGTPVDSYPAVKLCFSDGRSFDIFFDDDIELA